MDKIIKSSGKTGSYLEDRFVEVFCNIFGEDKSKYLYMQHPFVDIYGGNRFIDFVIMTEEEKIAIEVDGARYHDPSLISEDKHSDDLLKQNSLVYNGWKIYRWNFRDIVENTNSFEDELMTFLGDIEYFKEFTEYLPMQKGRIIELRDYQKEAIEELEEMRQEGESIALLHHATGERVIIVIGCINTLISRVSGTFIKNNSCIA